MLLQERCWVGYRRETGIWNAYLARNINPNTYSDAKTVICALKQTFLSDKSCRITDKCFAVLLCFWTLFRDGLRKKKRC
jgi:hypothetical protein